MHHQILAMLSCLIYALLALTPATGFLHSPVGVGPALETSAWHQRASTKSSAMYMSFESWRKRTWAGAPAQMVAAPEQTTRGVGTADLDWGNLGFGFRDVNCHVKFEFKDGRWGEGEMVKDPYVSVHIANTAMHYGQSIFEGLKAFHCKDGR